MLTETDTFFQTPWCLDLEDYGIVGELGQSQGRLFWPLISAGHWGHIHYPSWSTVQCGVADPCACWWNTTPIYQGVWNVGEKLRGGQWVTRQSQISPGYQAFNSRASNFAWDKENCWIKGCALVASRWHRAVGSEVTKRLQWLMHLTL